MNPLPPLRTVRPAAPDVPSAGRVIDPVLAQAKLPLAARALLQTILDLPLADPPAVQDFLTRYADRLAAMTTRERAANALLQAGLLTLYQRDRLVAENTFGLVLGSSRVL